MVSRVSSPRQTIRSSRYSWWWAALVLLGAWAWLVWHWPASSLWYDEALTTWVATGPWQRLIDWCTHVDIQVPLHYIFLRGWVALLGNSEFALRSLSVLCSILSVAAVLRLGWQLRLNGILTAALLVTSPGLVWIASEVRAYALALALCSWATVLLLVTLHQPRFSWRNVLYGLLMLGALYTHYTSLAIFAAHGLIAVGYTLATHRWRTLWTISCGAFIAVLGFIPWLPIMLTRGNSDTSYFLGSIPPQLTFGTVLNFKWLARDDFVWRLPDGSIGQFVPYITIALLLIGVGLLAWLQATRRVAPLAVGFTLFIIPLAAVAVIVYARPKLAGRYAWPAWLGLDLLLTCAVLGFTYLIRGRWMRHTWLLLVSLALCALPWLSGQVGHPPPSDYRSVFAYIRQYWQAGDRVLLRDGTLFPVADYYHSPSPYMGLPQSLITNTNNVLTTQTAVEQLRVQSGDIQGLWVVAWQGDVMDPQNVIGGVLDCLGEAVHVPSTWGDVQLAYYRLHRPLSSVTMPTVQAPIMATPDGVALRGASYAQRGGQLLVHTWWEQYGQATTQARISVRALDARGQVIASLDQPPAGWRYISDRWLPNTLILGRYALDLPAGRTVEKVELVLYYADQSIPAQTYAITQPLCSTVD